jgi:hypothetical protein
MRGPLIPGLFVLMVALLFGARWMSDRTTTFDSQHELPCYIAGAVGALLFGWLAQRFLSTEVETKRGARKISGAIFGFLSIGAIAYIAIGWLATVNRVEAGFAQCTAHVSPWGPRNSSRRYTEVSCTIDGKTLTTVDKSRPFLEGSLKLRVRRGVLGLYTY